MYSYLLLRCLNFVQDKIEFCRICSTYFKFMYINENVRQYG